MSREESPKQKKREAIDGNGLRKEKGDELIAKEGKIGSLNMLCIVEGEI